MYTDSLQERHTGRGSGYKRREKRDVTPQRSYPSSGVELSQDEEDVLLP